MLPLGVTKGENRNRSLTSRLPGILMSAGREPEILRPVKGYVRDENRNREDAWKPGSYRK